MLQNSFALQMLSCCDAVSSLEEQKLALQMLTQVSEWVVLVYMKESGY
jgi:hypothetical protein